MMQRRRKAVMISTKLSTREECIDLQPAAGETFKNMHPSAEFKLEKEQIFLSNQSPQNFQQQP